MKKLKILIISLLLLLPISVSAKEKVNLYLFHSDVCSHCQAEIKYLKELEKKYDNLKVHLYETNSNKDNAKLMKDIKKKLKITSPVVPFTVIGNYYYIGFGDGIEEGIEELIIKYSDEKETDMIKPILEGKEIPKLKMVNGDIDTINVMGKEINPKELSLPVLSVILGAIDGFNPCAMWVLIFLISMLFNMKDRKKMWFLGITFLTTSAIIYMIFMFAWLGIATTLLTKSTLFRYLIAAVALVGAFLNLKGFYKSIKEGTGCEVVDKNKRKNIMEKIKKITSEKSFILAILGVIVLAASVNVIELACSAGIPVLFTNVLAMNNTTTLQTIIYVEIYILFFLIDDIIVFVIAMLTLNIKAISTRYTKYSHLIGGILMLVIGLLMILKPEWLMFNF